MKKHRKNIIWLVSYPKSGNTWVRIFLQTILGQKADQAGIPSLRDIPIASNRMIFDNYLGVNSSDLTPEEILDCRPDVYRTLSEKSSEIQVLKVHDSFGKTTKGESIFPREVTRKVVYIVRNPLDVAVSYAFHTGKSISSVIQQMNDPDFEISKNDIDLKAQIAQHLGSWSEHVASWTKQTELPVILIQYEQLLENDALVFKELLDKLEISCADSTFHRAVEASKFKKLQEWELEYGFKEKPLQSNAFFREGKKDVYKSHLNSDQIMEIDNHHNTMMKELGYIIYQ